MRSFLLDFCAMRYTVFSRRVRVSVTSRVVILLAFATCRAAAGHAPPPSADAFVSINISTRSAAKCVETSDEQAMPTMMPESTSFATGASPLRPRSNAVAHPSPFEPATCRPTEPPFQAERDGEGAMVEGLQKRWQGEPKDSPPCQCVRLTKIGSIHDYFRLADVHFDCLGDQVCPLFSLSRSHEQPARS